jgi:glycosyltransferase involved in cell wall biosynthesis
LEAIPTQLALVDMCVFPSIWENFPNVCLEAMAAGRGVIGSSSGGMSDMLVDGAGKLIPPHSARAIAAAVLDWLVHPDARIAAGARARQRVLDCYNGPTIGARMEFTYHEAIVLHRQRALSRELVPAG